MLSLPALYSWTGKDVRNRFAGGGHRRCTIHELPLALESHGTSGPSAPNPHMQRGLGAVRSALTALPRFLTTSAGAPDAGTALEQAMRKTLLDSTLGVKQCVQTTPCLRGALLPPPHTQHTARPDACPPCCLPPPRSLNLRDVSGGCGAQFSLVIVADAFEGVPLVRQQRLVNEALKGYLNTVHSLTMQTSAPSKWKGT